MSGGHVIVDELPRRFPGDKVRAGCVVCTLSSETCARFPTCSGEVHGAIGPDAKTSSRARKRERAARAARRGRR